MNWQCVSHARDRVVDGAAEPAALGGDVDEGNRRRYEARTLLVHQIFRFESDRQTASAGDAARPFAC